MKTLVNVARYHLADRVTYLALPWGILAFSFLINVVISGRADRCSRRVCRRAGARRPHHHSPGHHI